MSTGGQDTGHLGPGDLLADLVGLTDDPPHREAPVCVLLSFGIGMTVTCLVVTASLPTDTPPHPNCH